MADQCTPWDSTWFTGGTRIRLPEVPGLVILQTEQFASNASERRGDQNWVLQRWTLDVYAQRHRVVAGNVANVETQGYSSRELRFEEYLEGASLRLQGARTHVGHLALGRRDPGAERDRLYPVVRDRRGGRARRRGARVVRRRRSQSGVG